MSTDAFNPEICFDTPVGRLCLPIVSSPTVPYPVAGGRLGDHLALAATAAQVRRTLDLELIVLDTIRSHDDRTGASRRDIAATLSREVDVRTTRAADALFRSGPALSRQAGTIEANLRRASHDPRLPAHMSTSVSRWLDQHRDFPAYLAGLPMAATASMARTRASMHEALADFVNLQPPPAEVDCGSTEFCAVMGFLVAVGAVTPGGQVGAAAGVVAIGVCCA
jgi:hypothetical protein